MLKSLCAAMTMLLASGLAGCGGPTAELPVAKAVHGGVLVALPSGKGFAEMLVVVPAPTKLAGKVAIKSRLVAYFFKPDGTTEITPGPTDVKVKIRVDGGKIVDLAPPSKDDGKYESVPGDYPDNFAGEIEGKVDGEAFHSPFRIR